MTPSSSSGGGLGPVEWRIEDPKVQVEPGRTKWQYVIRLRDTSGNGVHLDKLARKISGHDVTGSTTEWPIDVTIEPGPEVRIPCWDSVTTRASGAGGTYSLLNLSKTYSGQDGKGKPVQIQMEYELHIFMPPRKPVMLEFTLVTAESTATRRLLCEAIPKETIVFDPNRHDFVYLLIGIAGASPHAVDITPSGRK